MTEENISLTKVEAEKRATLVRGCEYQVELDFCRDPERYGFSVRLQFAGAPGAKTFVDAQLDHIDQMRWQGNPLDDGAWTDQRIELPPLQAENVLEVSGSSLYHRTGLGLHLAVDPSDQARYLYSDLEPSEAHRVFPCFDQPDLKGRFSFRIHVPGDWTVVSTEPGQQGEAEGDGSCWWTFPPTMALSPYVLGIAAGKMHRIRSQHGDIPLGLYAPMSLAADLEKAAPEIFEVTGQGLDFYRQAFGIPYPFSKYDQVFCLEKVNGAMESPACVTITDRMIYRGKPSTRERSLRAEVILHEMAHMWFGDLVTLLWWDDLWLNESFATFMAAVATDRATKFEDAWTFWTTAFKQLAVEEDQHSTSHPVVTEVPDVEAVHLNFDRITYQKGAAVLRQLAVWVGEEAFFAGVHDYLESHRQGNAKFLDLVQALERTSGRDVVAWSRDWLETVGINSLRCEVDADPDRPEHMRAVRVVQSATEAQPTIRPHRIAVGVYDWKDRSLVRSRQVEVDVVGQVTEVADLADSPRPALLLPNEGAFSYAKVRLDEHSLRTVEGHLGRITDSLARAVLWDATWDMVRDAEMPTSRYVQMVVAHLPQERDQSLIPVVLGCARAALSRYGAPDRGYRLEADLARAAEQALELTDPGGAEQIAWLRAFISSAITEEQVDRCRAMLAGERLPRGVELDLELRWRLVTALAARAAAGEEQIEAMTKDDPTSTGQVRGLAARAAMPSPRTKEEVFRHLTEDDSATVEETIWVGRSFAGVRQDDLLLPYIPRFFAALDRLRAARGAEYSRDLAYWMLPSLPPHRQLISAIEAQLRRTELSPDLRRIYQDALEEAERALRARRLDERAPADPLPLGQ